MTPDHHNLVLASRSHLPNLIAYTVVGTVDELAQVTSSEVRLAIRSPCSVALDTGSVISAMRPYRHMQSRRVAERCP